MNVKFYSKSIERAQRKSDKAIDTFMTTEKQLQEQVGIIDTTVSLIDDEIEELKAVKTAAIERRKENVGIIGRLREFIGGGD